jgi:hypothetical protein
MDAGSQGGNDDASGGRWDGRRIAGAEHLLVEIDEANFEGFRSLAASMAVAVEGRSGWPLKQNTAVLFQIRMRDRGKRPLRQRD